MIRRVLVAILCLAASGLGIGLFLVKHEVKSQESYLAALNRDILRGQEAIHVLNAEWSYLNDPVRLRVLAEKHLGMTVIKPTQIATLDTLDNKLRGGVPSAPAVMVAKAPTPAAQPTTQVASAVAAVQRRDVEPRRVVVPSPVYSAPVTYTAPSARYTRTSPAYAAAPERAVTASPSTAGARRVIVVSSPALARAPIPGGGQ